METKQTKKSNLPLRVSYERWKHLCVCAYVMVRKTSDIHNKKDATNASQIVKNQIRPLSFDSSLSLFR